MPHKLRKIRKTRGSRTQGYGRVGQHRKTSSKGGRKVGRHKHGWSYVLRYEPNYFGNKGFKPPQSSRQKVHAINVGELEELAEKLAVEKKLEKQGEKITLDLEKLGYDKLLGMGKVTKPILVKVASYSKMAFKKLEEAGGQVVKEGNSLAK